MIRWLVGIAALLSTLAAAALSTDTTAPDTPEPGSIEAIAKATGDPRFLSPWVSYLPQAHGVPSPLAFFGRIPGTPGEFVDTAKAHAYCRALAAASPRQGHGSRRALSPCQRIHRGCRGCGQKRRVVREHRALGEDKKPKGKGNADRRWLSRLLRWNRVQGCRGLLCRWKAPRPQGC